MKRVILLLLIVLVFALIGQPSILGFRPTQKQIPEWDIIIKGGIPYLIKAELKQDWGDSVQVGFKIYKLTFIKDSTRTVIFKTEEH